MKRLMALVIAGFLVSGCAGAQVSSLRSDNEGLRAEVDTLRKQVGQLTEDLQRAKVETQFYMTEVEKYRAETPEGRFASASKLGESDPQRALDMMLALVEDYPTASVSVEAQKRIPQLRQLVAEKAAEEERARKEAEAAKAKAEEARLQTIRSQMRYYTSGSVGIAVGRATFRRSLGGHSATGEGTFVIVDVAVINNSLSSEHANPNNFTLSSPDGKTVSHDTGTYGLNSYFDATDLLKGQYAQGFIAFYTRKSPTYTLHYRSLRASASKEIAPE